MDIIHNEEAGRFELPLEDGSAAFLDYTRAGDHIVYSHTSVPKHHEGKGLATQLAHYAMEYARNNGLRVQPDCPVIVRYVSKHPEYQSITDMPADTI
jgi:predicted GNAT family acetyltransferase